MHTEAHPLAGKTITINGGVFAGSTYAVEDWWDRVAGRSWKECVGNTACLEYAARYSIVPQTHVLPPLDDEVVYGKIDGLGKIIHAIDLDETPATAFDIGGGMHIRFEGSRFVLGSNETDVEMRLGPRQFDRILHFVEGVLTKRKEVKR